MAGSYLNGWKTLEKGEIARYEQFLLFPQFVLQTRENQGLFDKGLSPLCRRTAHIGMHAFQKTTQKVRQKTMITTNIIMTD